MIDTIIQYTILLYVLLFISSIASLAYRVKKTTGVSPIKKNTDTVYGFTDRILLLSYILLIVNILLYAFGHLSVYEPLDADPIKIVGFIIVTGAMITMYTAQLQMKENWRIGIDTEHDTDLVQGGLFTHLLHPIYLCAIFIGIGLLFIAPAPSTVFTSFFVWVMVSIQARLEETFMQSKFGDTYTEYKKKRKRYF